MGIKAPLQGTFTGTGTSESILLGNYFSLSLSGFGTGTVALERKINGAWRSVDTFTADAEEEGYDGAGHEYRFNCTAYTSGAIAYVLEQ